MKRNTWILTIILASLIVATVLVLQQPGEQSSSGEPMATLVDYDSAAIDRMEIVSSNGHVILEKDGDNWNITSPIRYLVAEYLGTRAVGSGRTIKLKGLVSSNPGKQTLFKVDSTGILVKFYERDIEKASIRIGKATTSFTETYVRREGSDDVFIADGMLASVFDRKPKDWRDKGIYRAPRESIADVKLHYGDTTISVLFRDSLWTVDGDSTGEPTSFIAALSKFETDEFVDTAITTLPKLSAVIEVNGTAIRFFQDKVTTKYFVQSTQSPQWFSIPLWKAKQVLKKRNDFFVTPKA